MNLKDLNLTLADIENELLMRRVQAQAAEVPWDDDDEDDDEWDD